MGSTTMGQRIAERRKLLNLSQEAFGEKMGVSRQAISKWEADGAVPEIEKLVAMSKLFGVSVGWLLGTEEETAAANPGTGFSEEQLKTLEEIVKRYQQPPQKQQDMIPVVIIGAMFLLAVGIVVSMFFGNYVNREMEGIHSQLSQLYSYYASIQSQLDDVSANLSELAQGDDLLSQYTLEAEAWEDMSGATVRFTAIPNATQAGDQAWLSVRLDGEEVANAMCTMDGSAYTAIIDLPAANGYSYYFQVVHTGGDSQLVALENVDHACENLETSLGGWFFTDISGWHVREEDIAVDALHIRYQPSTLLPDGAEPRVMEIELVQYRNGEEWFRFHVVQDGPPLATGFAVIEETGPNQYDILGFGIGLPETGEDEILLCMEAVLPNGTRVEQPIACWTRVNGELDFSLYAQVGYE